MQADFEVIKDVPGYKVILKAVLKSQIQQLVEQLAEQTGEESVILTASVTDGSLSHLGSESGKVFLKDHDDIKSQFLGFCLKRHHRQQEVEKESESTNHATLRGRRRSNVASPGAPAIRSKKKSPPSCVQKPQGQEISPQFETHSLTSSSQSPSSIQPVSVTRHEPYPTSRPQKYKKTSKGNTQKVPTGSETVSEIAANTSDEFIKIELADDSAEVKSEKSDAMAPESGDSDFDGPSTQHTSTNTFSGLHVSETGTSKDNSSRSHKQNDRGLASGSSFLEASKDINVKSSLNMNTNETTFTEETDGSILDPDISIKVEAITESEMELEITGVEPGQLAQSGSNWSQTVEGGLGADQSHTVSSADQGDSFGEQTTQEYTAGSSVSEAKVAVQQSSILHNLLKAKKDGSIHCSKCQYATNRSFNCDRHVKEKHSSAISKLCNVCGKAFKSGEGLKHHLLNHKNQFKFICQICGKGYNKRAQFNTHESSHLERKPLKCEHCNKRYQYTKDLRFHLKSKHGFERISHTCSVCNGEFSSKDTLREHQKTVHDGKQYVCKICNKPYRYRSSLNYHVRSEHGKGKEGVNQ